ncbi:acyltransferase [Rhodococcus antarcticus]|uniref:Acyltransferase n=2 Tax=Rhodococcus antarcticus TaxID=2987751 RepID=A0ABY6P0A0_9NOCA|nr:acyltransferase [Rhodococcus antarcticus]UZJ24963.1 acyltransferase [Rhodococcus antarcticus]
MSESSTVRSVAHQGAVGVSFFFILSGFLLAWARSADAGASRFYRRRFARIYPLHAATWAIAVALALLGLTDAGSRRAQGTSLLLVQAWFPSYLFAGNKVSWSLSCELLFYLLFPLIVMTVATMRPSQQWAVVALCAILAVFVIPWVAPSDYWAYNFPPARLIEFIAGVCLAHRVRDGWRCPVPLSVASMTLVLAAALSIIAPSTSKPVAVTAIPIALVILAAVDREQSGTMGLLGHPRLVTLGVWSFALYLVHNIIVELVLHVTGYLTFPALAAVAPCVLLASVGASYLAHRWIEAPAERRLRGPGRRPVSLDR